MKAEEEMDDMDVWKNGIQQDIQELKSDRNKMKDDIHMLQLSDVTQNNEISALKESLSDIKEDTKWIRRMITKAIVSAIITGLIGGLIALFLAKF
ncbi:hemolysin XhlA family protein [Gracilibacillus marinus]|uniref:Hemolysin XhlA family protein n=1 Tax=Gracilibacillus marinus TaxID=630535 RepID=A0ABV8W1H1_9BACI